MRAPAATNVARLRVRGCGAAYLPKRLLTHGVAIRSALNASVDAAEFELFTNETLLRRPTPEVIDAFLDALGPA